MKRNNNMTLIFDLDGTVIDSSHRYAKLPDGSIDLDAWLKNCTRDNIMRDRLLPLADTWRKYASEGGRVSICTSRIMTGDDIDFLSYHGLKYHYLMSRAPGDNTPCPEFKAKLIQNYLTLFKIKASEVVFFEDHAGVREAVRSLGIISVDPTLAVGG
jgi:FMN phosphatase YigB (HAD superfamily)